MVVGRPQRRSERRTVCAHVATLLVLVGLAACSSDTSTSNSSAASTAGSDAASATTPSANSEPSATSDTEPGDDTIATSATAPATDEGTSPSTDEAAAPTNDDASPETDSDSDSDETTLPPGAVPGFDDYDEDGEPDPTCGTQDFGGGLVLRIPCSIGNAHEPEDGTELVDDSLYRLPGSTQEFPTGHLVEARDADGAKVVIIVFNTDGLFASGSATIDNSDNLDAAIEGINALYPGGVVQVRGHTDSVGSAASNQTLSERRARTVQEYLESHGLDAASVTAVGLAATEQLVKEQNADGSVNPDGQRFNRRVEIVVRLP